MPLNLTSHLTGTPGTMFTFLNLPSYLGAQTPWFTFLNIQSYLGAQTLWLTLNLPPYMGDQDTN